MEFLEYFSEAWVWRAIISSSLVGIMCGALGCFIVLRNMALIGDALSHAILPGVVVAFVIFGYSIAGFFLGSVLAGLLTAVVITWVQQKIKTKNDAAIGIIFTAMFSLGVIGISYISRNEGVHLDLKDFLFGNILGVSNEDVYLTLAICIYVVLSLWFFYRYFFITTFQGTIAKAMGVSTDWVHYFLMILLSFSVVASLQTVGVILVVAMLITPASSALMWSNRLPRVLMIASVLGLLASVSGFVIALILDTTPGPAMVVTATLIYFISAVIAPENGLLSKFIKKRNLSIKILREDILKFILKKDLRQETDATISAMIAELDKRKRKIMREVNYLSRQGLIAVNDGVLSLRDQGKEKSMHLVRAHRLWESYLHEEIGLQADQIHDSAEEYEHLLSEDTVDEIDKSLGYPSLDPHGSPIPVNQKSKKVRVLSQLSEGEVTEIAKNQFNQKVLRFLLKNDITGQETIKLIERKDNGKFLLQIAGAEHEVDKSLAKKLFLAN